MKLNASECAFVVSPSKSLDKLEDEILIAKLKLHVDRPKRLTKKVIFMPTTNLSKRLSMRRIGRYKRMSFIGV